MTQAEHRLVVALALGLRRILLGCLERVDWKGRLGERGYVHAIGGAFQRGAGILWDLQVASGAFDDDPAKRDLGRDDVVRRFGGRFPPYLRFFEPERIREALARGLPDTAPTLEATLPVYVGLMGLGPADGAMPHRRAPFHAPDVCVDEIAALRACGCLARQGSQAAWTDAIAPAMRAARLWDESGRPFEDLREGAFAAWLRALPPAERRALAAAVRGESGLQLYARLSKMPGGPFHDDGPVGSVRKRAVDLPLLAAARGVIERSD